MENSVNQYQQNDLSLMSKYEKVYTKTALFVEELI